MAKPYARIVALLSAALVPALTCGPVSAQTGAPVHGMAGMSMPSMGTMRDTTQDSAATRAYKDADKTMMMQMSAPPYSGDADADFVSHMIPHHQGAIDMARVELKYGKDSEMKRLASSIVKAQQQEIAMMRRWQAAHRGSPAN